MEEEQQWEMAAGARVKTDSNGVNRYVVERYVACVN